MKKKLLFIIPCCLTILSACGNKQSKETYQLPNPRVELYDVSDFEIVEDKEEFFTVAYSQALNNIAKASSLTNRQTSYYSTETPLNIPNYDYDDISFMYSPSYKYELTQSVNHIDLYSNDVAEYVYKFRKDLEYISGYNYVSYDNETGGYAYFYDEANGEIAKYKYCEYENDGYKTERYLYGNVQTAYFGMGIDYLREANYFDWASFYFKSELFNATYVYGNYDEVSVGKKGNTYVISAYTEDLAYYENKLTNENFLSKPKLNKNGLYLPNDDDILCKDIYELRCVFEQVNGQFRLIKEQHTEKDLMYCDENGNPSETPLEVYYIEEQSDIEYNKRTQKKVDFEKDSDGNIIVDEIDFGVEYCLACQQTKTSPLSNYCVFSRGTDYLLNNKCLHEIMTITNLSYYYSFADMVGNVFPTNMYSERSSQFVYFWGNDGQFTFNEQGVYCFTLYFDDFLTLTSIDINYLCLPLAD